MSFSAPPLVRVGMTGNFSGKNYRVAGRCLMGETESGETYYWNEFNLVSDAGEVATLVYEDTDSGGQWKMFTLFEPSNPVTAAEAATKRVGNWIDLDGTNARITLLGRSQVYQIEGEAPEGVEQGDLANYFNAEAGHRMTVVSWTGDEVECYHGITITSAMVAKAFNLDAAEMARASMAVRANFADEDESDDDDNRSDFTSSISPAFVKTVLAFVAILLVIFAVKLKSSGGMKFSAGKRYNAPPMALAVGSTGQLQGHHYSIVGRSVVEVATVGWIASRNELLLRDDNGDGALLVNGLKPGANDWWLFQFADPPPPLTPQKAGNIRAGSAVTIGGVTASVRELYRLRAKSVEGAGMTGLKVDEDMFGFQGESGTHVVVARWNESNIAFQQGQKIDLKEVATFEVKR